jgi:hypothetical protein
MTRKHEFKLIGKLCDAFRNPDVTAKRWVSIGWTMVFSGLFVATALATALFHADSVSFGIFVVLVYLGGITTGLGSLYLASGDQWPLLTKFLNRNDLEARRSQLAQELKDSTP